MLSMLFPLRAAAIRRWIIAIRRYATPMPFIAAAAIRHFDIADIA